MFPVLTFFINSTKVVSERVPRKLHDLKDSYPQNDLVSLNGLSYQS